MKLLVVIPTYDEAENIERIIDLTFKTVPDVSILVVDDNSPDGTAKIVKGLNEKHAKLFLLEREGKGGLASAYITGFDWGLAKGYDVICEMDADFSHNPEYLIPMRDKIVNGYDYVIGSRYVRGGGVTGWGALRKIISRGGSLYAQFLLGGKYKDLTGGYNMWTGKVLRSLDFERFIAKGYLFQIEMKHRARKGGFKGAELAIIFPDREQGQSKMSGNIFIEALREVWKIRKQVK